MISTQPTERAPAKSEAGLYIQRWWRKDVEQRQERFAVLVEELMELREEAAHEIQNFWRTLCAALANQLATRDLAAAVMVSTLTFEVECAVYHDTSNLSPVDITGSGDENHRDHFGDILWAGSLDSALPAEKLMPQTLCGKAAATRRRSTDQEVHPFATSVHYEAGLYIQRPCCPCLPGRFVRKLGGGAEAENCDRYAIAMEATLAQLVTGKPAFQNWAGRTYDFLEEPDQFYTEPETFAMMPMAHDWRPCTWQVNAKLEAWMHLQPAVQLLFLSQLAQQLAEQLDCERGNCQLPVFASVPLCSMPGAVFERDLVPVVSTKEDSDKDKNRRDSSVTRLPEEGDAFDQLIQKSSVWTVTKNTKACEDAGPMPWTPRLDEALLDTIRSEHCLIIVEIVKRLGLILCVSLMACLWFAVRLLRKCLTQCLMVRVNRRVHEEDIKALHLLPPSLREYINQEAGERGMAMDSEAWHNLAINTHQNPKIKF
eukprot:s1182_g19.t2